MKTLLFYKGMMAGTITGEKYITFRKYRDGAYEFSEGEAVQGIFKDGLNVILEIMANPEKKIFKEITDEEARENGFEDAKDAFEGLRGFYPDLQETDSAVIIRFKVWSVDGVPAVEFNEYMNEEEND